MVEGRPLCVASPSPDVCTVTKRDNHPSLLKAGEVRDRKLDLVHNPATLMPRLPSMRAAPLGSTRSGFLLKPFVIFCASFRCESLIQVTRSSQ